MASYYTDRVRELQIAQVRLIATATKLRAQNARLRKKLKELKGTK